MFSAFRLDVMSVTQGDGHRLTGTRRRDMTALHSGRPLYLVVCETCDVVVHDATTSMDPEYWSSCHQSVRRT